MFLYIEENLEKIRNPEEVMMIRTMKGKVVSCLGAYLKNGEIIKLTKPKNFMTYPFAPFAYLNSKLERFYWNDFEILLGDFAINKKHLDKFVYCNSLESAKRFDLFVYFNNGTYQMLAQPEKKYFFRKVVPEIEEKFGVEVKESGTGLLID